MVFQLRQKENFPVLECENGFWELILGILVVISSWLQLLTFTKFIELRFTVLILLDVLLDIKFCFKYWKETLWLYLEHLQYEIFTPDITFSNTFSNVSWLKLGVFTFYPEETIIEISNSFHWQNIILCILKEWINSFNLTLIHECIPPKKKINLVLSIDVP